MIQTRSFRLVEASPNPLGYDKGAFRSRAMFSLFNPGLSISIQSMIVTNRGFKHIIWISHLTRNSMALKPFLEFHEELVEPEAPLL